MQNSTIVYTSVTLEDFRKFGIPENTRLCNLVT